MELGNSWQPFGPQAPLGLQGGGVPPVSSAGSLVDAAAAAAAALQVRVVLAAPAAGHTCSMNRRAIPSSGPPSHAPPSAMHLFPGFERDRHGRGAQWRCCVRNKSASQPTRGVNPLVRATAIAQHALQIINANPPPLQPPSPSPSLVRAFNRAVRGCLRTPRPTRCRRSWRRRRSHTTSSSSTSCSTATLCSAACPRRRRWRR